MWISNSMGMWFNLGAFSTVSFRPEQEGVPAAIEAVLLDGHVLMCIEQGAAAMGTYAKICAKLGG